MTLPEQETLKAQIQRLQEAMKGHELTPERGLAHVSYMRPEQLAAMGIKSGTGQTE